MKKRALSAMLLGVVALASCEAPVEDDGTSSTPQAMASGLAEATDVEQPDEERGPRPMLRRTAWRSEGEDGAIYATYLDDDGRYRDLKNGGPDQVGNWRVREDGAICFLPDGENVRGDCWELDRPDKDGKLLATHSSGRRVKLQRIDYQPPEDE